MKEYVLGSVRIKKRRSIKVLDVNEVATDKVDQNVLSDL